jgi:AraC family transcriptional regulator, transcriptional activator of pobA
MKEGKQLVQYLDHARPDSYAANVPAYVLYGEERTGAIFGFFHIESLQVRTVPNKWRVGLHRHPDFDQLLILSSGRCTFEHDSQKSSVEAGSCVFTPANVVHQFCYEPGAIGTVISVSSDFAAGLSSLESTAITVMLRLGAQRVVTLSSEEAIATTRDLTKLMFEKFSSRHPHRRGMLGCLFSALLLELGAALDAPNNGGSRTMNTGGLFRRYRDLVQATIGAIGFSDKLRLQTNTVEAFAAGLSTTPYALNVACQNVCGCSARDLIHTAILEQATRLLLYTTLPMKEISFLLGYSHASHFTRFFKQRRGTTPETFRSNSGVVSG